MPGPGAFMVGDEERSQVEEVMSSGHLSRFGSDNDPSFKQKVTTLEKEFAQYSGVAYCIATNSGTSSLLVSLLALGIGNGDEVIVPAYSFIADYSAIIFTGATPVIAEIDESLTLDPADVERRIRTKCKAIMVVHMAGNLCDMDSIIAIAKKHDLYIIEDCCQAAGASYKGKKVGTLGDIACFSLNIFKTITAGDGGLIITDDKELYSRAYAYHDQGHTPARNKGYTREPSIIGLNFRMTELTGAVALSQVQKLDSIVSILRKKKKLMKEHLGSITGIRFRNLPDPEGECASLLGIIFPTAKEATRVAMALNIKTLNNTGLHVYSNMEQILYYFKMRGIEIGNGSFPITDDLLSRSLFISIGVVDADIGAGFGVNIHSTEGEILIAAQTVERAILG